MWIFFALLTPIFWSFVHVLDSHCVDRVFEKPWMGMITSALASTVIVFLIPFILPAAIDNPPANIFIISALLAGVLIQISQLLYFNALERSEAGIVAAYWNFTPALLPFAGYFLAHDYLPINNYVGIGILVMSSVFMCTLDTNFDKRWQTFFLMFTASVCQVFALLLEDVVYTNMNYLLGFFFTTSGIIITGIIPFISKHVRKVFSRNMHRLRPAMHIFFGIEVINLFALASSQKAISLGNPSLVAAVETTVPAYTFLLSILLLKIWPPLGDPDALHKVFRKILLVALMAIGVWLVY